MDRTQAVAIAAALTPGQKSTIRGMDDFWQVLGCAERMTVAKTTRPALVEVLRPAAPLVPIDGRPEPVYAQYRLNADGMAVKSAMGVPIGHAVAGSVPLADGKHHLVTVALGNPVDAMRAIAQDIADATGLTVDHDAFDQAKAYCDEPVLAPARKGEWMQTFTGRQYWPLDPRAADVDVEDIAHHLSMLCRYCGACLPFWSVAEHSVGVLVVIEGDMRRKAIPDHHPLAAAYKLAALLHDAPEAYCHDLIRPIKRCVQGYDQVEAANADAIALALNLPLLSEIDAARIKLADNAMLLAEQEALMAPSPAKWAPITVPDAMLADARAFIARNRGETCTPREAKALFRAEFAKLAA